MGIRVSRTRRFLPVLPTPLINGEYRRHDARAETGKNSRLGRIEREDACFARTTFSKIAAADFVQVKGFGLLLWWAR
jgi:hypothetical protein